MASSDLTTYPAVDPVKLMAAFIKALADVDELEVTKAGMCQVLFRVSKAVLGEEYDPSDV